MVVNAGNFYVYVKQPGSSMQYRRVPVAVAQEKDDHVVIESGLKSGDEVVTVGALILDQMFDNARVTRTEDAADVRPEGVEQRPVTSSREAKNEDNSKRGS
jgi:multidrug efflux pump subunit AcrA (membrane-fusion protein)